MYVIYLVITDWGGFYECDQESLILLAIIYWLIDC